MLKEFREMRRNKQKELRKQPVRSEQGKCDVLEVKEGSVSGRRESSMVPNATGVHLMENRRKGTGGNEYRQLFPKKCLLICVVVGNSGRKGVSTETTCLYADGNEPTGRDELAFWREGLPSRGWSGCERTGSGAECKVTQGASGSPVVGGKGDKNMGRRAPRILTIASVFHAESWEEVLKV